MEAVIFDMDGVLVDSPKYNWKAMNKLLGEEGVNVSDGEIKKYLGRSLKDQLKMLKEDYGIKEHDVNEFSKKLGRIQFEIYERNIKKNSVIINFLEALKSEGIKFALATSSHRWRSDKILELLSIKNKFDIIITAEDTEKHKPDPEIYLKTAEKLEVDPKNCVAIEDAVNGIQSGKNAGMKVIALLTDFHTKEELKEADLVINSLNELNLDLIKNLN